jgi:hypothetical protein
MRLKLGLGLAPTHGIAPQTFTAPAGFNWDWTSGFKIQSRAGTYSADFTGSHLANPAGTTYYVDPDAGNNGNTGLSDDQAFSTIQNALQASNASIIMLKAGYYTWLDCGWLNGQPAIARDTAIKVYGGDKAILHTGHVTYNWSPASGQVNTYKTAYNAVGRVIDLTQTDEHGVPIPLTKRDTIADVEANAGSYYYPSSSPYNLHVHTYDGRIPDADIMAFQIKDNFDIRSAHSIYAENVEFWGGRYPLVFHTVSGNGKEMAFKNCGFAYSSTFEGLRIRDLSRVSFMSCYSAYNLGDGFAYRQNVFSVQTDILEANCKAFGNADFAGTADNINGSSVHDGCRIIRIGGTYERNAGGQIADTHANSQSLNLGCAAGENLTATQNGTNDTGYRCTASASMWMKDCTSTGSYYDRVNTATMTDLGGFGGTGLAGDYGTIS